MKLLKLFTVAAALGTLVGCRPEAPDQSGPLINDRNGNPPTDGAEYKFVSYEVLLSALEDTLGVVETPYVGTGDLDGSDPSSPDNPREDPIGFLKARGVTVGEALYNPDAPSQTISTGFSSLGMKNWLHATSGACAKAVVGPKADALFPPSATGYDAIYLTLLGRYPTGKELDDINTHTAQFSTREQKNTVVCTALLGSMEFLTVN